MTNTALCYRKFGRMSSHLVSSDIYVANNANTRQTRPRSGRSRSAVVYCVLSLRSAEDLSRLSPGLVLQPQVSETRLEKHKRSHKYMCRRIIKLKEAQAVNKDLPPLIDQSSEEE